MNLQELTDGLTALGFDTGYAAGGDPAEIILWENRASQPTKDEILAASAQGAYLREVEAVKQSRQAAYVAESDPLNFKWQETELPEDKQAWLSKKAEIKERFPDPVAPKAGK